MERSRIRSKLRISRLTFNRIMDMLPVEIVNIRARTAHINAYVDDRMLVAMTLTYLSSAGCFNLQQYCLECSFCCSTQNRTPIKNNKLGESLIWLRRQERHTSTRSYFFVYHSVETRRIFTSTRSDQK